MTETATTTIKTKLPALDENDDLIPRLDEVIPGGGHLGVTYVYVMGKNINKFRSEGFDFSQGHETLDIMGESFVLMYKGTKVGVGGGVPELFIDSDYDAIVKSTK